MIRLAKRMSRAAFGIGIAIGILLAVGLQPAAMACVMPSPAPIPDTPCVDLGTQPQEVLDYVNLQCQVHQTLFNDGSQPGVVFGLDKDVTQPGKYECRSWDGRAVTLEAIMVYNLDLKSSAPNLYNQGMIAHAIIGKLYGPAGNLAVAGLVMYPKGVTTDTGFMFQAAGVLSATDYETYTECARIGAGVRVLDITNLKSTPLDSVTSAGPMWASSSDPASLYANGVNGTGQSTGGSAVDTDCVKRAYAIYNVAVKGSNDLLNSCMIDAVAFFVLAMTSCVATGFLGTPIWTVICSIAALANQTRMMLRCANDSTVRLGVAMSNLKIALAACGLTLAVA